MPRVVRYLSAIRQVLLDSPEARDDDAILIYKSLRLIVQQEYGHDLLPLWSVSNYLGAIQEQRVPPPDSITRLRRMLQKEHPLLRGKRYNERHGLEPLYQEELGYYGSPSNSNQKEEKRIQPQSNAGSGEKS